MKFKQILAMPIGMLLLAIAILIKKFLPDSNLFSFLEGFLIGLSIVLNIYYIIVMTQKNKEETK